LEAKKRIGVLAYRRLGKKSGVAGVQDLQNETRPNSSATGAAFPPGPDPINAFLAAQCIKLLAYH